MKIRSCFAAPLAFCMAGALPVCCFGQSSAGGFGIAVGGGTLGAGAQAAVAVASKSNVRFGVNYFKYTGSVTSSNITYNGSLRLESAELLMDQYIAGGLHISAGTLIYDGNRGTATASVPGGQTFSLNSVSYFSASSDPVHGTGAIASRKVAPEILVGIGNLVPRSKRHFTANIEAGVGFQGSPNAVLSLGGSTCLISPTVGCSSIATNPTVQANVLAEQNKINNNKAMQLFKFYPIVRLTFGYKF